ncbi:tyrosine-type recombinase/integrase [Caldilinea sp.]|uniref:tyrosine-type recombinase/integrase n=1 Tax=Caldilinea sp. TaxID=2293560 RepID=UPI0021DED02C|nr:tyrosine-type recombinase/integrase [Caldilinea sp.]GIV73564.1 MAG: tyrosine recombinase XerC [Caldilinea sp.]
MTPYTLLDEFLTAKRAAGLSERTLRWYEDMIRTYLAWRAEKKSNQVVWDAPQTIEAFLAQERASGVTAATIQARYRALSALFEWRAKRAKRLGQPEPPVPTRVVERPRVPKKAVEHVTVEEFRQLYDSIAGDHWTDWRDRTLLLILFWSGLRVSEAIRLSPHHIDTRSNLILVERGKGGKARQVPCVPALGRVLVRYLYARPPYPGPELFVSNDGASGVRGPLSVEGVRQMLRRRCKTANLRYMNPHAFRHGFAMALLNAGMDLSAISAAMGHSSEQVTSAIYARWITTGLSREYEEARKRIEMEQGMGHRQYG